MPDDLKMMKSPDRWPSWPYLPLKRRSKAPGRPPETGVLMEDGLREEPVLKFAPGANLFHLDELDVNSIVDADPERLVAEGWEVD